MEQLYAVYWQIQYQLEQAIPACRTDVERKLRTVFNDPPFLEALKAAHYRLDFAAPPRLFLEATADSQTPPMLSWPPWWNRLGKTPAPCAITSAESCSIAPNSTTRSVIPQIAHSQTGLACNG